MYDCHGYNFSRVFRAFLLGVLCPVCVNAALEVLDLSCLPVQLIYSRNGVNITSTPVQHYTTAGPVALRLDYNGLSVTYSGATPVPVCTVNTCCPLPVCADHRAPTGPQLFLAAYHHIASLLPRLRNETQLAVSAESRAGKFEATGAVHRVS